MKNAEKGAKKCKRGLFRLFQHPFSCKTPKKTEGRPFEDFKQFRKEVSQSRKRGGESLIAPKNWKGHFWVLHFKAEAFGCVQNQVLSTFGKSEYFTKSGTYAMS